MYTPTAQPSGYTSGVTSRKTNVGDTYYRQEYLLEMPRAQAKFLYSSRICLPQKRLYVDVSYGWYACSIYKEIE